MMFVADLIWGKIIINMSYFVVLSSFTLFGKQQDGLDKQM